MGAATERQIRVVIDTSDFNTPGLDINGSAPAYPSGSPVRWDFLFTYAGQVITIPSGSSVQMIVLASTRTGPAYFESAAVTVFDNTTTQESWDAGTNQHFTIRTAAADLALDATPSGTEYFMLLDGSVEDSSVNYTPNAWGWCQLKALATGWPVAGPVIGAGNIVPVDAAYSSGGAYTLTTVANQFYVWTPGANDTNLVNGANTYTVQTTFQAAGTTCTLNGTDSQPVTATVSPAQTLPASLIQGMINAALAAVQNVKSGSFDIPSGVEEFVVDMSALGLGGAPTTICPFIEKPAAGGDNLIPVLQQGWSSTAFTIQLTGVTQSAGYKLGYIIIP